MSKSLIKTVDGIGIWVADTTTEHFGVKEIVGIVLGIIVALSLEIMAYGNANVDIDIVSLVMWFLAFCIIIDFGILYTGSMFGILFQMEPAYKVYPGSDIGNSITILKTPDSKADQLAICKAAREIESRCHEIAAKRAELDRIAAGCK